MTVLRDRAGVLFDLDGTLVDTASPQTVCWWEPLRQHDQVVPMAVGLGQAPRTRATGAARPGATGRG